MATGCTGQVLSSRRPSLPVNHALGLPLDVSFAKTYAIPYVEGGTHLTTITATEARKRLYSLLDDVASSHEPIEITGRRVNAVLVSEDDWRAVQETLHLLSIPGMRESILEGMETPVADLEQELDW